MKISRLFISTLFSVALSITASAQHDHSSMGSGSNMNMNLQKWGMIQVSEALKIKLIMLCLTAANTKESGKYSK
jgi:hypothetical protein